MDTKTSQNTSSAETVPIVQDRIKAGAEIINERYGSAKQMYFSLALLALLCLLLFFLGTGQLALVGPDEPRYAEVAREMFTTGDYISPRLCGCLWFEKPVLIYWMAAAAYHFFGVNEFAARIPSGFSSTVTVLFFFLVLRRVRGREMALATSIVLLTSSLFIGLSRAIVTDTPLAATMGISLLSFYAASVSSGASRGIYWVMCWFSVGLSLLAKGLPGFALFIIIAGFYCILNRTLLFRIREWAAGIAIMIIVASSWYVPVTIRHGYFFIEEFFINQHFKRYLTDRYHHPGPVYFYIFIIIAGMIPWTFFLIPAAARLKGIFARKQKSTDSLLLFAWIWMLALLIFFSISKSKLSGYILPAFPALAIIIGHEACRIGSLINSRLTSTAKTLTGALLFIMGWSFPLYLASHSLTLPGLKSELRWIPVIFCNLSVLLLVLRPKRILGPVVIATLSLILCAIPYLPEIGERASLKSLSLEAAAALEPGEKIAFYLNKEYAPVFYAKGRVACGVGDKDVVNAYSPEELAAVLDKDPSVIVITYVWFEGHLTNNPMFVTQPLSSQGDVTSLRVRLNTTYTR